MIPKAYDFWSIDFLFSIFVSKPLPPKGKPLTWKAVFKNKIIILQLSQMNHLDG